MLLKRLVWRQKDEVKLFALWIGKKLQVQFFYECNEFLDLNFTFEGWSGNHDWPFFRIKTYLL